jgi:hypothetical protein
MTTIMRAFSSILAALLVALTGCHGNVVTTDAPDGPVALQTVGPPLGDGPVIMIQHDGTSLPTGTFIAQDKSKGVTWLFDLAHGRVRAIELPYNNGNHETAVNVDGTALVSPHYETLGPGDNEGGGFYPGAEVSVVDLTTGNGHVLVAAAIPLGRPKPHGAHWMDNGDLLVTAQVANSIVRFTTPLKPDGGAVRVYSLQGTACGTPHLVSQIPGTNLAVSGCRCDKNPDDPPDCTGQLAVVDLDSGRTRVLPAGTRAEGLTVTPAGEVWVGSMADNTVDIFGFRGPERDLDRLEALAQLQVDAPLRLAYEPSTNSVGIVSFEPNAGDKVNFHTFDAASHVLRKQTMLVSARRGRINSEGLAAANGVFITGGFDNQTLVIVDPVSLEVRVELLLPRCSLPPAYAASTPMTVDECKGAECTGKNNWSGGVCPPTLRNPDDQRFIVFDGFGWSPLSIP